jgi:diguanylate cyclase
MLWVFREQDMSTALSDVALSLVMVAIGSLVGWWLRGSPRAAGPDGAGEQRRTREVMARLQELASHIAANVGAHSSRVEAINQELQAAEGAETEAVVSAVTKLIQANQQMQQQLDTAEERLQEQARLVQTHAAEARTDPLTGLANRRALNDELARRWAEFQRSGKVFSLVIGDIDQFKQFNDKHGHQVGDEVLRVVAGALWRAARATDLVARYGGEEFVVILPEMPVAGAGVMLERLRKAVESASLSHASGELKVTVSLGAAEVRAGEDAAALMRRADAALYASKAAGRNCAYWHDGRVCRAIGDREEAPPQKTFAEAAGAKTPPSPRALCSRNEFAVALGRRLAEWRRGGAVPAVLLVRIDDYAGIEARHGQQAASKAMQATARFLTLMVREMDTAAQYGERSFALLLPGAGLTDLLAIAGRIRDGMAGCELAVSAGQFAFTVSVGGALSMKSDETQVLLWRAEEALDAAENAGGNCCYFHNGQRAEGSAAAAEQAAAPVA